MRERTALILVFVLMLLATTVDVIGLTLLHASDQVVSTTVLAIACLSAYAIARVVMHYPPDSDPR